ncbi:helix-turn-helix domain-containing protein [Paenibacillus sp. MBLB4367]|uniref:helix-turn-helix domain-containing protein n=1 Tax=Paenibacillus sp. MBLB4367 TaxID=3384767 RepID=UPI003907F93D
MSFGTNLRYYRIRKGLTLQELGDELDVSANYLSKLENENGKLKPEFLPRLCSVLKIQMTDLYEEDESKNFFK